MTMRDSITTQLSHAFSNITLMFFASNISTSFLHILYFLWKGGYNQAFILHVLISRWSSPDGIHTKLWSSKKKCSIIISSLMAIVCLEWRLEKPSCVGVRDKAVENQGGYDAGLSLKSSTTHGHVFRATAASETFPICTMLGQFSGNQIILEAKSKAYTENTMKQFFFSWSWQKSNATSLLGFTGAVWAQLSGKDRGITGNHSSRLGCAQVQ